MKLSKKLTKDIYAHAKADYPAECCGMVINKNYYPCQNTAVDKLNHFKIDPEFYLALSEIGEIGAIVHSHPNGTAEPSEFDRIQMGLHGIDWIICAIGKDLLTDDWQFDIKTHTPTAHNAPLLGREYVHGYQDCYMLVQDYYKRELDIKLPNFDRKDDWWEDENHEPLYQNNFEKAGFMAVDDLQPHDVILCRVGRTHHINHALIFLGDKGLTSEPTPTAIGNSLILHHPHSALSKREIYGESWIKRTALVVRHRSLV